MPVSIRREIERLERKAAALEAVADLDLEVHEIIQGISHVLDRIMNDIWKKINKNSDNSNKPHIYFPLCLDSNKLQERFTTMQLSFLAEEYPKIYEIIRGVQPFTANKKWLQQLKTIANLKHERPPRIDKEFIPGGVGIGRGASVYIEEMIISNGRIERLSGHEIDYDGKIRPITVELFREEMKAVLEGTDQHPRDFVIMCCAETKSLASKVFNELPGS